jgi:1-acyl-sn-glycerol-3-phosphate acyltransferase
MIRALLRSLSALAWILFMLLPLTLALASGAEGLRKKLVILTFRVLNGIFGLKVVVHGQLPEHRPLLMIANHCSYLDILVIGGALPVSFTPKREIAGWPLIGYCCRLAGCVFVERTRAAISKATEEITRFLQKGRIMCVFAEGTTNDGTALKPFRSALFSVAELPQVQVLPVTVIYSRTDGRELDAQGRRRLAWFGDDALLPHLWNVLQSRSMQAELYLHAPIDPPRPVERKQLCEQTETIIRDCFATQTGTERHHG